MTRDFPYKSAISNFITYSMLNSSCSELLSRAYIPQIDDLVLSRDTAENL